MNDHFGVGVGAEGMALSFQRLPETFEVVNFAIEDDPNCAVFVLYRLMSTLEIDDAQTAHSQSDSGSHVETFVVRAAVNHRVAHRPDFFESDGPFGQCHDAGNPTH